MIKQFRDLEKGEFFVVGVDTSAGGLDYCAAQFLSVDNHDVPLVIHSKKMITEITPAIHDVLERVYDLTGVKPVIAYERNNGGVYEFERLASLNRKGKYKLYESQTAGMVNPTKPRLLGWNTTSASRPKMLADLKDAIDNNLITVYDPDTVAEFMYFVVVQTSTSWKATAEGGAHDDLIFALAIAYQLLQTERKPSTTQNVKVVNFNRANSKKWSLK